MTPAVLLLAIAPLFWLALVEFAARDGRRTWGAGLSALMAAGFLGGALVELQELLVQRPSPHVALATGAFALSVGHAYALRAVTFLGIGVTGFWLAGLAAQLAGDGWAAAWDAPGRVIAVGALVFLAGAVLARRMPERLAPLWRTTGLLAAVGTALVLAFDAEAGAAARGTRQAAVAAACVLAMLLGARRGWRDTLYVGAAGVLLVALALVSRWFGDALPPRWYAALVGLVLALVLLVTLRLRPPRRPAP